MEGEGYAGRVLTEGGQGAGEGRYQLMYDREG